MKEQDFIEDINKKTSDLPIPDSISPDNMKKMLDSHTENQNNVPADHTNDHKNNNHRIRRYTVAACVALCLVGSIGAYQLLSGPKNGEDFAAGDTPTEAAVEQGAESAESNDSSDTAEAQEELAYQTNLQSPSSYEEYYDTLKAAYDAYYDSISQVETYYDEDFNDAIIGADSAATGDDAVAEDSAATGLAINGIAATEAAPSRSSAKEEKQSFSGTNTQEQNVDEGDVIKTDGTYIYKVVSDFDHETGDTNYRLSITKTDNGALNFITSIDLGDIEKSDPDDHIIFQEFYLYKDQLFLMYNKYNYSTADSSNESYILSYDLKDKSHPKKGKTLSQSGWYVSSRISNGYLYTISNFSDTSLEDKKKYDNYVPIIDGETIECKDIYYPKDIMTDSTYVITSLDLSKPVEFNDTKAVPTAGGSVYVSDSSIYLYATLYKDVTSTEIMKIAYDKSGTLTVGNSAMVTGYLYDSFALSEYDNHLRVVATIAANNIALLRLDPFTDSTNSTSKRIEEDVNALYILDSNMELTGKLTGLAPGERIYSARFLGDIGYFVTYRNTDPLFSVDLSDPANPRVLGELKIPGFSNYLHFYGENILLGIGQETDPETQEFLGLKLSMFDISNPADVKEKDKYIIENSNYSEALYDHKAIMIDPVKNVFGFAYHGRNWSGNDYSYRYATFTYDAKDGFSETAGYTIKDDTLYGGDSVRGLYIGDYFYLSTNQNITSYKLGDENPIATVYFQ